MRFWLLAGIGFPIVNVATFLLGAYLADPSTSVMLPLESDVPLYVTGAVMVAQLVCLVGMRRPKPLAVAGGVALTLGSTAQTFVIVWALWFLALSSL